MKINLKRAWIPVTVLVVISLYALAVKMTGISLVCLFNSLLHIYCITCGATRMVESLLHLQIYQAFRYNPFIFVTSPFIIFMLLVASEVVIINKEHHRKYYICLAVFIAGALLFMLLRNTLLPCLAPVEI